MAAPARRKRSPNTSPQTDPDNDRLRRELEAALVALQNRCDALEARCDALELYNLTNP